MLVGMVMHVIEERGMELKQQTELATTRVCLQDWYTSSRLEGTVSSVCLVARIRSALDIQRRVGRSGNASLQRRAPSISPCKVGNPWSPLHSAYIRGMY